MEMLIIELGPMLIGSTAFLIARRSIKVNQIATWDYLINTTFLPTILLICFSNSVSTSDMEDLQVCQFQVSPMSITQSINNYKKGITSSKLLIAWENRWNISRKLNKRRVKLISNNSKSKIRRTLPKNLKWSSWINNKTNQEKKLLKRVWTINQCYRSEHARKLLRNKWLKTLVRLKSFIN